MARAAWPDEDSIGKRFRFDAQNRRTVVGVVADVRQWGLEREVVPEVYLPYSLASIAGPDASQARYGTDHIRSRMCLVVRTSMDPLSLVAAVRNEVLAIDQDQPLSAIRTMEQVIAGSRARRRFITLLTGLFGSLALVLVAAGIYGTTCYYVAQRTHEIGIRMALGARRAGILKLVVGQGLKLAMIGLALGQVGVAASTRLTASMLFGVSPTDPLTLVGGALLLTVVAVLGSGVPARRASKVDPIAALRRE